MTNLQFFAIIMALAVIAANTYENDEIMQFTWRGISWASCFCLAYEVLAI